MENSLVKITDNLFNIRASLLDWLLATATLGQAAAILIAIIPAILLAPSTRDKLSSWSECGWLGELPVLRWTIAQVATDARQWLWLVLLAAATFAAQENRWPGELLQGAAIIVGAVAGIRLLHACFESRAWDNTVTVFVWIVAGLALTDMLAPAVEQLDAMAITIGAIRLSPVVKRSSSLMTRDCIFSRMLPSVSPERTSHTSAAPSFRAAMRSGIS